MKLRPYQQKAVDSILRDSKDHPSDNLLVALPTGTGKSLVIARLCQEIADRGGRVLVLHRSKELVYQNHLRFTQVDPKGLQRGGIYSAGIGIRQTDEQVTFAGVQSVYKRGEEFGWIDAVIVDEAHQIPQSESSQYQQLIRSVRQTNPKARFFGLTATPYRMSGGVIFGSKGMLFDRLSYSAPLSEMFDEGYLTKPTTLPTVPVDMTGVRKTAGDFNQSEMQSRFLGRSITAEILATANETNRKSIAVFASGVAHATLIHHELQALGEESVLVTGETLPLLRAAATDLFMNRKKRWIVNVDCLTTGWDAPCTDCIVVARATESAGLFMQIVGRGTRLYEGKEECHVIDFGSNIERFGPIDAEDYGKDHIKDPTSEEGEAPKKICPKCFEVVHASLMTCPSCQYSFPPREKVLISTKAEITVKTTNHTILHEDFKLWKGKVIEHEGGKKTKKPDTLLVQYKLQVDEDAEIGKRKRWAREWLCVEHKGYAREKFEKWWKDRSHSHPPETIDEALVLIDGGALAKTLEISLRPDGKFERITKHEVAEKPEWSGMDEDDDCPF